MDGADHAVSEYEQQNGENDTHGHALHEPCEYHGAEYAADDGVVCQVEAKA